VEYKRSTSGVGWSRNSWSLAFPPLPGSYESHRTGQSQAAQKLLQAGYRLKKYCDPEVSILCFRVGLICKPYCKFSHPYPTLFHPARLYYFSLDLLASCTNNSIQCCVKLRYYTFITK
jgi:hypothetical protein